MINFSLFARKKRYMSGMTEEVLEMIHTIQYKYILLTCVTIYVAGIPFIKLSTVFIIWTMYLLREKIIRQGRLYAWGRG